MAYLLALPRWAKIAAALALLAVLLPVLKGCYDRGVVRENEAKVAVQVAATSSAAADAAATAATGTRTAIQKGNDDARQAAAAGTDPLGDGLRSLRAQAGADRAAARRSDDLRR